MPTQKLDARRRALESLASFSAPLEEIASALADLAWDCDEEVCELRPEDVAAVLHRFLTGHLTREEVEGWAELVELRDGLFIRRYQEELVDIVAELANPDLTASLDEGRAKELAVNLEHMN